jgi:hypothetical protein
LPVTPAALPPEVAFAAPTHRARRSALATRAVLALLVSATVSAACGDAAAPVLDESTGALVDGLVLDSVNGIVIGIQVQAAQWGADCAQLEPSASPLDTDTTNSLGRFVLRVTVPDGPVGAGCIRIDEDFGSEWVPLDTGALRLPVTFSLTEPIDTTRALILVRRR